MRRRPRYLFAFCPMVSLVLFMAACAFWVRGHFRFEQVQVCLAWQFPADKYKTRWLAVQSYSGMMRFGVVRNDFDLADPTWAERFRQQHRPGLTWHVDSEPNADGRYRVATPGLLAEHDFVASGARQDEYWNLQVPPWLVCLLFSLLPTLWLVHRRRARKARQAGLCSGCGYDLRASPERCPECGAVAPCGHDATGRLPRLVLMPHTGW